MNAGGSGPRRLQLHPNGKFLYVNHETDSKVSVFEVDGSRLKQTQTLPTLPADHKGNNTTAEIQIDQTGTWLYVTNRGHDSIAHYAVDPAKGTLTLVGHIPSGGRTPATSPSIRRIGTSLRPTRPARTSSSSGSIRRPAVSPPQALRGRFRNPVVCPS